MLLYLLLLESVSIYTSLFINIKSYYKLLGKVVKKGYKIDMEKIKKVDDKTTPTKKDKIINTILLLLPGINIINSLIKSNKRVNESFKDEDFISSLVPLDEEELKLSKTLTNDFQRAMLCASASTKEEDNIEVVGFEDNEPIMVKNVRPSIKNKTCNLVKYPVPHMSYTYDEVVKLNNSTHGICKCGNADGRSVAIIGLKDDTDFNKISFNQNEYSLNSSFVEYSNEEAMKHKYVVYPYPYNMEDSLDLTNSYNEIVKERQLVLKR